MKTPAQKQFATIHQRDHAHEQRWWRMNDRQRLAWSLHTSFAHVAGVYLSERNARDVDSILAGRGDVVRNIRKEIDELLADLKEETDGNE